MHSTLPHTMQLILSLMKRRQPLYINNLAPSFLSKVYSTAGIERELCF